LTRKSGETSSTHIIDDVLKTERVIVPANTRSTSAASMTFSIAMTMVSTACSQRGAATPKSTGVSAGKAGAMGTDMASSNAGRAGDFLRCGAVVRRAAPWGGTLAVRHDLKKLIFVEEYDRMDLSCT